MVVYIDRLAESCTFAMTNRFKISTEPLLEVLVPWQLHSYVLYIKQVHIHVVINHLNIEFKQEEKRMS